MNVFALSTPPPLFVQNRLHKGARVLQQLDAFGVNVDPQLALECPVGFALPSASVASACAPAAAPIGGVECAPGFAWAAAAAGGGGGSCAPISSAGGIALECEANFAWSASASACAAATACRRARPRRRRRPRRPCHRPRRRRAHERRARRSRRRRSRASRARTGEQPRDERASKACAIVARQPCLVALCYKLYFASQFCQRFTASP